MHLIFIDSLRAKIMITCIVMNNEISILMLNFLIYAWYHVCNNLWRTIVVCYNNYLKLHCYPEHIITITPSAVHVQ